MVDCGILGVDVDVPAILLALFFFRRCMHHFHPSSHASYPVFTSQPLACIWVACKDHHLASFLLPGTPPSPPFVHVKRVSASQLVTSFFFPWKHTH